MNSAGDQSDQQQQNQLLLDEMDELDQISRVALLIDDLSNEDPSAKLHSIKRLTQIALLLGPERCIEELIPMVTELIDKIDNNSELMMNLAEQLGLMSKYLGAETNAVHLIKPLEQILPADDSVVREKAVESLKIVGAKIAQEAVYEEFMPMVKRMRRGDLFSMRIAACFLYAQIYGRLDDERREYTRVKFHKLAKDDTPMVRRGAAQSLSILTDSIEESLSKDFTVPLLKSLLQDDNDSVKIMAVYSALPLVQKLLKGHEYQYLIKEQIIPPFKQAAENKMITWRLRFSVAEIAAQLCEHFAREIVDNDIVPIYENLLVDKEPEVKSEAVAKLHDLSKYASASRLIEKLIPNLNSITVNDNSQHVRSSLALSVCDIAKNIGKDHALTYIVPVVVQLLKDPATEVRIILMQHLRTLTEIIGHSDFDRHIIPQLSLLAQDKIWRVKLALVNFMPQLAQFMEPGHFNERMEPVILGLLSDPVFQIREEAINLMIQLKEQGTGGFDQRWLQDSLEAKAKEFHTHEKFAQRIHTLFLIQKVAGKVDNGFLNERLFPFALKLSEDPVPNIRFNFAKVVEQIHGKLTSSNMAKVEYALEKMIENEKVDFDVKYYAERALKTVTEMSF